MDEASRRNVEPRRPNWAGLFYDARGRWGHSQTERTKRGFGHGVKMEKWEFMFMQLSQRGKFGRKMCNARVIGKIDLPAGAGARVEQVFFQGKWFVIHVSCVTHARPKNVQEDEAPYDPSRAVPPGAAARNRS